jgi:hypothetical protein
VLLVLLGATGPSIWTPTVNNNIYYIAGNVGIGQSIPQYQLDVSGNTNIRGNLIISNDVATNGNIFFNGNLFNKGVLFTGAQWSNGATAGNIYYTGNVGIGTTDPQYPLDISGRTNIFNAKGVLSLQGNSFNNMAVGTSNYTNLSSGSQNTAFGYQTLQNITTGLYNAGVGYQALNTLTTGSQNTAVGYQTLNTSNASNNTAVGYQSLKNNTGSNNTALGYNAYSSSSSYNNSTAIGYSSQPTASNQIILGTTAETIYIPGNVGIGNYLPVQVLDVSGSINVTTNVYATQFISTSDYRIKENPTILDTTYTVDKLKPIHYINKLSNKEDLGFLAHEVQEIFPYLVEGEKDGETKQAMNYTGLIAVLVKEIQVLKTKLKTTDAKLSKVIQFLASFNIDLSDNETEL